MKRKPIAMRELPSPSPSPSPSPLPFSSPPHASLNLSPPLIAMVVVVGTAFLIVLYTRVISQLFRRLYRRYCRWRRRRRLLLFSAPSPIMTRHDATGNTTTISFGSSSDYFIFSPYGLDDSSIKSLPTSFFSKSKAKHLACTNRDCAVCLLEFEDNDYIRTLPYCSHAFHVECIDVWLRSHATCPLCRASVIRPELNYSYSPFVPMRASRIRPSLDDFFLLPPIHLQRESISELEPEIEIEIVPGNATSVSPPTSYSSNRRDRSNLMLKRSYSFGFERNLANERMVLEPSTASPWQFRQHHRNSNSFWSKRWPSPSPFQGSASASRSSRVFSFRSYRAIKSPFNRRRTDSSIRLGHGPGLSARRARSMTVGFYSSRMRCGDPEALLSPERLNNR